VLTAWALRRAGMRKRTVADKTISFLVLTYLPYVFAVIVCGFGLHWGLFGGRDPFSLTFVPAVVGVVMLAAALAIAFIPTDLQRRMRGLSREGRLGPADAQAGRGAGHDLGRHPRRARAPALARPGADGRRAVLGASRSRCCGRRSTRSGDAPPLASSCRRFPRHAREPAAHAGRRRRRRGRDGRRPGGVRVSFDLALVAVLVYRAFTFWLPLIPGVIAYFRPAGGQSRSWKHRRTAGPPPAAATLYKVK
jgi:hypothetical protein